MAKEQLDPIKTKSGNVAQTTKSSRSNSQNRLRSSQSTKIGNYRHETQTTSINNEESPSVRSSPILLSSTDPPPGKRTNETKGSKGRRAIAEIGRAHV